MTLSRLKQRSATEGGQAELFARAKEGLRHTLWREQDFGICLRLHGLFS